MGTGRTLAAGVAAAALGAVGLAGCFGGGAFSCSEDSQCGVDGTCEPNNLCSFPDLTCLTGRRYGDAAGSLSGICVGDEPPDASTSDIDASITDIDSPPGTPDANCIVDGLDLCAEMPADPAITFGNETLDTDGDPRCRNRPQPGGGEQVCLVYASSITVPGGVTLTVTGDRPLALASTGVLVVDGTIDAGSTLGGNDGPDADVNCGGFPANPENDSGGAGGAAGGSYAGNGGDGGIGDTDSSLGTPGPGLGGAHIPGLALPAFVRGGCQGQDGADEAGGGGNNGQGGDGGNGGGGVWLVSMAEVRVNGGVRAAGAGGEGGESQSGGGGGGAGGMIRIGAPVITVGGQLSANGGGGGGGGGNLNGNDVNGGNGTNAGFGPTGGAGGTGAALGMTVVGGNGGTGGGVATDGLIGGSSIVGAGGGGGGAGFIVFTGAATVTGTVSPAAIQN